MVHMIPVLWKNVQMNVKSNRSWEGWILTYLTMKVLFQKPVKAMRNNPFFIERCTTKHIAALLSKYSNEEDPISLRSFESVFDGNDKVMVRKCYPSRTELKSFDGEVIMIVFDVNSSSTVVLKDGFDEWDLRLIRVTNESLRVSNNCFGQAKYMYVMENFTLDFGRFKEITNFQRNVLKMVVNY